MTKKGTKTKKSAKVPRRAKQLGLGDGFERKKIEALEEKADEKLDVQEELASLRKRDQALDVEMAALVAEHGIKKYEYEGRDGDTFEVTAETKSKVKVRRKKQAKAKSDE